MHPGFQASPYRDLLQQLNGTWAFERNSPGQATMTGTAVIAAIAPDLSAYEERGTLTTAEGRTFQFARKYRYRATEKSFDILFDETPLRLYQSVSLVARNGGWRGSGFHLCSPDEYRSDYSFDPPDLFMTTHNVTGPRKSYLIETRYRRAST